MIDVAAYALLKRGITTAGTSTPGVTIMDAKIENGELILIMTDGTTINAGALPTGGITEEEARAIAYEAANEALVDYVPQYITGGGAQG